tara:strand:+ start:67 stop:351 length:285 start_codon:yes stop_codon:yes gene_type:complete
MGCKDCQKNKKLKIFKWKYMKNFLRFLYQNVKSGFKQVSYDEYNNRLALCKACIFYNHEQVRCNDCGCYVKNKAKFKTEVCPQGFWRKLDVRTK